MHGRYRHAHDRQDGRIRRMSVDHRVHFRARFEDIAVKAPFAGGTLVGLDRAVQSHEHDLLGLHGFIGRAGRRDQQAVLMAQADISRRALINAEAVHAQAGVDDGLALRPVAHGWHQLSLQRTCCRDQWLIIAPQYSRTFAGLRT